MSDTTAPRSASTPLETLSAGRELDALVAEKVMGWKDIAEHRTYECGGNPTRLYGFPPEITWSRQVPYYSRSIEDAWEVVEKMRERGFEVCIGLIADGAFCRIDDEPGECAGRASVDWRDGSTPLAICLAALRTVDVLASESEAQSSE